MGDYQPAKTIAKTLREIHEGKLVLPAIQRKYEWKPSQVIGLFDSIMRGYPIGSFLSWQIDPATAREFRFYRFLKDFSQFDPHNRPIEDLDRPTIAILDGQQRLTSLNIGLRGSYAVKEKHGRWNNPSAFPSRSLHLNLLGEAGENDLGLQYDFRLMTSKQVSEAPEREPEKIWFPVNRVFDFEDSFELMEQLADIEQGNNRAALRMLNQLHKAVHVTPSLHFYEETAQDVERVLDIFIRVNSGGTPLSYSNLLLSTATAQWKERDAREAIHGLVNALNATGQGFRFSEDIVLKSALMLVGIQDLAFKVRNFTAQNMSLLDQEWDSVSDSLQVAAGLLSDFGLSEERLTARSVLLPVAYYVHRRKLTNTYRESTAEAVVSDRQLLKNWTLRSLVARGIWGSGLDSLLGDLRTVIDQHGKSGFPVLELERAMARRGKSLTVDKEFVDGVLDLTYGGKTTFATLALIFDHVNTRNDFHQDHVFPKSLVDAEASRLRSAGVASLQVEELRTRRDQLPNLQLLEGLENIEKRKSTPTDWVRARYPNERDREHYRQLNVLTDEQVGDLPASATEFSDFWSRRREALAHVIAQRFSSSLLDIYAAQDTPRSDAASEAEDLDAAFE